MEKVLMTFPQAGLGILGISGNLLGILVFSYKKFQKHFYTLMITNAIYDLIYLIMAIMLFALPTLFRFISVSKMNYLDYNYARYLVYRIQNNFILEK